MNPKQTFLATAMVVGTASMAHPLMAGDRVMLNGNIEMRISIADEIGNPVLEGRFVRGDRVMVTVTLSDMSALKARALAHEAMLYATRAQRTNDPDHRAEATEKLNIAEAAQRDAKRSLAVKALDSLARRLVVRGLRRGVGDPFEEIELPLQSVGVAPGSGGRDSAREAVREVRSAIDTSKLPAGVLSVRAEVPAAQQRHGAPAIAEAQLQLVSLDQATPAERGRSAYVKAHAALETGRFVDAARLAKEAADFSPPLDYYQMASWHVLGDAQFALGDRPAALAAYREALRVAEQAFPKSHLRAIVAPRIRELEGE